MAFQKRPVLVIDLQLFAQEKTEQATPKKQQEARRKGQVAKSPDIGSALSLLAVFTTLVLLVPHIAGELGALFNWSLQLNPGMVSEPSTLANLYMPVLGFFIRIIAPLWAMVLVVGLVANFAQVGFVFSLDPLQPKPERLNPVEGAKRIFSRRSMVQLLKSMAKLAIVLVSSYFLLRNQLTPMALLGLMELSTGVAVVGNLAMRLGLTTGGVLLVLGVLDLYYQRWEHNKNIMMSKQEIKDELKQMEGDPQIRSRIRERQRQMSRQRMMAEVPQADVVITNPTHFAIALKYDPEEMGAPQVVAKGRGHVALRIKEIAVQNGVAQVENPSLARGLYWAAEVGDEIPAEFYQGVAEVLAFIYQLRQHA